MKTPRIPNAVIALKYLLRGGILTIGPHEYVCEQGGVYIKGTRESGPCCKLDIDGFHARGCIAGHAQLPVTATTPHQPRLSEDILLAAEWMTLDAFVRWADEQPEEAVVGWVAALALNHGV